MDSAISPNTWNVLVCSACGGGLEKTDNGLRCAACGSLYPYADSGSLDLRLRKPRTYSLDFTVGDSLSADGLQIEPLRRNDRPAVDFSGLRIPRHLTGEMLGYFPRAQSQDSLMLDLGCGKGVHKEVCERAGFEWVGLDYESAGAPIWGDAHSLPFKDDSFEFILSIAVLEHIRYPFVMMREAHRVLKPGGKFIGTVAFLEPFHNDSFYHHSHLGTLNSLQFGGFTIEKLAPSEKWSVLVAQASNGLFPKMPRALSHAIVYPVQLLHKLWWKMGSLASPNLNDSIRVRNTTGSFTFIATKNA